MRFNIDKSSSIPRNMVDIMPQLCNEIPQELKRVLKQATRQLHSSADQNTFKFDRFFKFHSIEKKSSDSF